MNIENLFETTIGSKKRQREEIKSDTDAKNGSKVTKLSSNDSFNNINNNQESTTAQKLQRIKTALDEENDAALDIVWFTKIQQFMTEVLDINLSLRDEQKQNKNINKNKVTNKEEEAMQLLPSEGLLNDLIKQMSNVAIIEDAEVAEKVYRWLAVGNSDDKNNNDNSNNIAKNGSGDGNVNVLRLLVTIFQKHPNFDIKFQVLNVLNDLVTAGGDEDDEEEGELRENGKKEVEKLKLKLSQLRMVEQLVCSLGFLEVLVAGLLRLSGTSHYPEKAIDFKLEFEDKITEIEKQEFVSNGLVLLVSLIAEAVVLDLSLDSTKGDDIGITKTITALKHDILQKVIIINDLLVTNIQVNQFLNSGSEFFQIKKVSEITPANQYASEYYSKLVAQWVIIMENEKSASDNKKNTTTTTNYISKFLKSQQQIGSNKNKQEPSYVESLLIILSKFKKPANKPLRNTPQENYFEDFFNMFKLLLRCDVTAKREFLQYEGIELVMLMLKNYFDKKNYIVKVGAGEGDHNTIEEYFDTDKYEKSIKWVLQRTFALILEMLLNPYPNRVFTTKKREDGANEEEEEDEDDNNNNNIVLDVSNRLIEAGFLKQLFKPLSTIQANGKKTTLVERLFPLSTASTKREFLNNFLEIILVLLNNLALGSNERLRLINKLVSLTDNSNKEAQQLGVVQKLLLISNGLQKRAFKKLGIDKKQYYDFNNENFILTLLSQEYVFSEEHFQKVAFGFDTVRQIDMILCWLMLENESLKAKVQLLIGSSSASSSEIKSMQVELVQYKHELEAAEDNSRNDTREVLGAMLNAELFE